MPTPNQVREHYKKCRRYFYLLLNALNEAHEKEVINYEAKWNPERTKKVDTLASVCERVYEAKENFEEATKNARANAFKQEVLNDLKGKYDGKVI